MPANNLAGVEAVVRSSFDPAMFVPIVHAMIDAQAMALALRVRRELVPQVLKDDRTLVTAADLAVQAIVAGEVHGRDPRTPIIAEEDLAPFRRTHGSQLADAVLAAVCSVRPGTDRAAVEHAIGACSHDTSATEYWTLDPIDGTKGFVRGDHFAIALARIREGAVIFAILACPTLPPTRTGGIGITDKPGPVFIALRGGGAWQFDVGGDPGFLSHVRLTTPTPRAFRVCESVETAHSAHEMVAHIVQRAGASPATLRVDGQTKYAFVARGDAEAYLRVPVPSAGPDAIWDHAAGSLLGEEAGATVTDLRGACLDFSHGSRLTKNVGIVCAHPALHERLLHAIAQKQALDQPGAASCGPTLARVVHGI